MSLLTSTLPVRREVNLKHCFLLFAALNLAFPCFGRGDFQASELSFSPWITNIARLSPLTSLSAPVALAADFNADGRMDLLLHGATNNDVGKQRTLIFTNRGNGTLGRFWLSGQQGVTFSAADWNRDGQIDLFRQGAIMLNTNGGLRDYFTIQNKYAENRAWIDFDADGDLDAFAVGGTVPPTAFNIWVQGTNGLFATGPRTFLTSEGRNIVKGDFDGDGRMDWFVIPYRTNLLTLCLRTGGIQWIEKPITFAGADYHGPGVAFDVDNDGRTDILLSPGLLFRSTPSGFEPLAFDFPRAWDHTISIADLNGDGFTDIVFARGGIYLNDHGTNFHKAVVDGDLDLRQRVICAADLNGDGSVDVVVDSGFISIWTNALPARIAPQTPKIPEAVSVAPDGARFTWGTPVNSGGFTYNVRVGTTPSGIDIVSPNSDIVSGVRRIIEDGNAGPSGQYQLDRLPAGTYYWAVQSVDQSFRGSAFTGEQVFEHVTTPQLQGFSITNTTSTGATMIGEINPGGLETRYIIGIGTEPDALTFNAPEVVSSGNRFVPVIRLFGGLQEHTSYYVKIIASNAHGTNELIRAFTTEQFAVKTYITTKTNVSNLIQFDQAFAIDFDGDGKMDFMIDEANTRSLLAYRNSGIGFEAQSTFSSNIFGFSFDDWNHDGRLDISALQSQNTNANNRYFVSDGRESFFEVHPGYPPSATSLWLQSARADLDMDGIEDLIVSGQDGADLGLFVFWGTADGFSSRQVLVAHLPFFMLADLDNNGYADIVVMDFTGQDHAIFNNYGAGRLLKRRLDLPWLAAAASLSFADVNSDGWLDFGYNVRTPVLPRIFLALNGGGESFQAQAIPGSAFLYSVDWGDYDFDGRPDLIGTAGQDIVVLRNSTAAAFTEIPVNRRGSGTTHHLHWIDADQDGDLDILSLERETNVIQILENRGSASPAPQPPINPQAEVTGTGVSLRWVSSSASQGSLTFNVRVGTAPGTRDVVDPLVVPGSKSLLTPRMGNSELRTFTLLTNLPPGGYYWAVQTVDWAYRTSDFTPEQTFTIQPDQTPLALEIAPSDPSLGIVAGQRSRRFAIETSLDLASWRTESTNTLARWQFPFPLRSGESIRFVRVRSVP